MIETEAEDRAPKGVETWRKKFATRNAICGLSCPTHGGSTPGFCERSKGHIGMHSHELRQGMKEFDPTRQKGHSWDGGFGPIKKKRRRNVKPIGPF